ncbi:tripartite tricarboxylate transporter TctB family protein [Micromonospora cathayae]|uniref:Tripartite tricarboxylate transporter TctB family protein n=1 Tax=Micromonospora cathayae TaxID=3028804 RepID=A0ABY7ZN89_9ACTN|nr:tripartite tricarboxylate transporter TctB family protein [Micromonospora sp. HUAS 3]WDZ83364.1 tripartite tricarboxylate transporter TctB family protein [Micromonospora sp. HUAS 3]
MTTTHPAPDAGDRSAASPLREAALGGVFLLVGVVLLVLARSIELPQRVMAVSPRIWPEMLAYGIIGLSVLQIVGSVVRPARDDTDDETEPATRIGILRVAGFVLATAAFGVLWYYVHFLVSATVFIAALTWIAGGRGVKDLVLFPAGVTAVLYVLFALLLKVPV